MPEALPGVVFVDNVQISAVFFTWDKSQEAPAQMLLLKCAFGLWMVLPSDACDVPSSWSCTLRAVGLSSVSMVLFQMFRDVTHTHTLVGVDTSIVEVPRRQLPETLCQRHLSLEPKCKAYEIRTATPPTGSALRRCAGGRPLHVSWRGYLGGVEVSGLFVFLVGGGGG